MIVQPKPTVTEPPTLAEVLAAHRSGAGAIAPIAVVHPLPTRTVTRAADAPEIETPSAVGNIAEAPSVVELEKVSEDPVDAVAPISTEETVDALVRALERIVNEAERVSAELSKARGWATDLLDTVTAPAHDEPRRLHTVPPPSHPRSAQQS